MKKKLSIIVPVYNEINTIKIVIQKLKNLKLYKNYKKQILIIDDCSTDGTAEFLKSIKNKYLNFFVIFLFLVVKKYNLHLPHLFSKSLKVKLNLLFFLIAKLIESFTEIGSK